MLLKQFFIESAINSAKVHFRNYLVENVTDYLSLVVAQINHQKPQDLFRLDNPKSLNLDHLALIVTGLKIIADPDYRMSITKNEIGININDAKELFNLLNQVDKQGKDSTAVENIFKALSKLSPQALKKQRAELEILKVGNDAERKHTAMNLQKLGIKVSQMFNKIRGSAQSTRGVDVSSLGDVGSIT